MEAKMFKIKPKIITGGSESGFNSFFSFHFLFFQRKLFKVHNFHLRKLDIFSGRLKVLMNLIQKRFQKMSIPKMTTCLLFVFVLMFNYAYAGNVKAFHWVDDEDAPPTIYRGADGKPTGIFYEIMKEAFHRLNIPLKVELYPWVRAQKIVSEGKADGMVTVLTEARKPFFIGSVPVLIAYEHIFVNKNNPHLKKIMSIRSLKEARPFKIVETIGSGWTKENLKGFNITWVPNMDSAFNMLIKCRVDIYIANGFIGAAFIKKKIKEGTSLSEGYKCILTNPYPLKKIVYRLLIRKNSSFVNIINAFNKTISQMRKDGTIQRILEGMHPSQNGDTYSQK